MSPEAVRVVTGGLLGTINAWIELVSRVLTLLGALLAGLWVYAKFVVERGLLPPSQFSIDCTVVGRLREMTVLEIILRMKNVGASSLIAGNIRVDVRVLDSADEPTLFKEPEQQSFGRLRFPRSLREGLQHRRDVSVRVPTQVPPTSTHANRETTLKERGIRLLKYDTFVQAGVEQLYTFVTAVPNSTALVLVWSSFEYAQHPSRFQAGVLWLSRRLGLLQYSLDHVTKPHTAERVFSTAIE